MTTGVVVAADPLATEQGAAPVPASAVRVAAPANMLRTARGPLAVVLVVLTAAFGVAFFQQRVRSGALDPTSVSPAGSRAVAELLRARGIELHRVTTPPTTPAGTIFLPFAGNLSAAELTALTAPTAGVHVVLVAPDGPLNVLGVAVTPDDRVASDPLAPGCNFAAATTAGRADVGGALYQVGQPGAATVHTCYAAAGRPSLVRVERGGGDVTILGSAAAFTNGRLDKEGDAALALALLDRGVPVTWVLPRPAGTAPQAQQRSLFELLPDGLYWGVLQLVIAALFAMLWRGRRLGPVVTERLPAVVRAAEAVEGRGRLYAAAKARGRAGLNLRYGAQTRLRTRLGLPPDAGNEMLVEGAAARSHRAGGDIGRLLYGPDPVDDAALVRLAADLDQLDSEVRRS